MSKRDEQKYLWLLHSSGMKILREGQEFRDIFVRLMDIHDTNNSLSKKLHQICARLEFVEQLKYTSALWVGHNQERAAQYQLDRLITYLTLTCVDIAAGREFKDFPKWLKDELQKENLRTSLSEMIATLQSTHTSLELQESIGLWVRKLYHEDYLDLDNQGIGRKFRKFLSDDLPEWLRNWFAEVYVIVYGDKIPFLFSQSDWFKLDVLERCKLIAKHLFEMRNKYTHTVEYLPAREGEGGGTWGVKINENHYEFSTVHKDGDIDAPIVRWVGLKKGFIESDVIRLIVIVQLRAWLGIEDEPPIIQTFMNRASYRRLGFGFLKEIDFNLEIIQEWCTEHLKIYHDAPVISLIKTNAEEFIRLHQQIYSNRDISLSNVDSYLKCVESINQQISAFRKSFGEKIPMNWEIAQSKWKLLDDGIVGSDELRWLVSDIYHIRRDLFQRLDIPYY
jgi:hypothetical protein